MNDMDRNENVKARAVAAVRYLQQKTGRTARAVIDDMVLQPELRSYLLSVCTPQEG